ncbi:Protein of unknown function DUF3468 [Penicillium angulare]|uniref:Protein of unknown function DUF3468 n=1 Tax=Penicillium angulare TaxID=116970 RepID=UPI00253FDD1C|nr:Protein of unknown function DUF3468 [Penicillium angulare]KAJ5280616.1 Protein of unknown function DUF3468 [Penicillium angulare]
MVLSQQLGRPRLTRLDTKARSASIASSVSSTTTSMSSDSLPIMTDLMPDPAEISTKTPPPQTNLSSDMEETLGLQDLELMMHWCTTTYRSMARDHAAESLWQTVIPRLSLRFPSLRHGLLALSALHVAGTSTSPERKWRYLAAAREHQGLALAGINISGTQEFTDSQCDAHFALCGVLMVFSFAYCLIDDDVEDEERPDILDEFLEVFQLTRWLVGAMVMTLERVTTGELYSLVRPDETRPRMPNMSRLVISSLQRRNETEALRDSSHEKETFNETILHLSNSLEQLMNGGEPKDFAFCWCFHIPVRYPELVAERNPFALVILAHYAVVLHHLRDSWWMGDWGIRLLKEIVDELEPEWRDLIAWPADAMGWFLPDE